MCSVFSTSYEAYDALGRVLESSQTTGDHTYAFSYTYNLEGAMTSQSYPSGLTVQTEYDEAGRVAGVKQATGGYFTGAGPSDPDRLGYAPHGAVTAMKLGNGLWQDVEFNSRLQAEEIRLSSGSTNLLALNYGYGSANINGNVLSQQIAMPGLSLTQNYAYDTHEAFAHPLKLSSNPFLQHRNLQGIPGSGSLADHSYFVERRGTLYDSRPNTNPDDGIRPLHKEDQSAIEERLKPIHRKYKEE